MMTRIAFFGLALSAMLLVTACGPCANKFRVKSGSNVNNGPGPVGDILVCDGLDDATIKLTIRHTAAVTLIQGLLQMGDQYFLPGMRRRPTAHNEAEAMLLRRFGTVWIRFLVRLIGRQFIRKAFSALKTSGSYDRSKSVG